MIKDGEKGDEGKRERGKKGKRDRRAEGETGRGWVGSWFPTLAAEKSREDGARTGWTFLFYLLTAAAEK
jgi:hypothetical protein